MDNHVSVLNCPSCGAALDLDRTSTFIRCKFCGNVVQISGEPGKVSGAVASQPAALTPALEEIRQLARGGKMIEAIKRYRALYNVGLAEAKSAVEALMADRWVPPSSNS
jgi:LSD1 subclass zinc finger protein